MYGHTIRSVAKMTIRSTYALDVDTVRALETVANRWGVSKSEALRRSIRAAVEAEPQPSSSALETLDRLQRSVDSEQMVAWAGHVRGERRESSLRRTPVSP
jgi:hypothetical protein